jgi:hypothetical protein
MMGGKKNQSGRSDEAGMGGLGFGLRVRPTRHFALDFGLDFVSGKDYQGYTRSEVPFTVNAVLFANPRDKTQLYFLAGLGWSTAHVALPNDTTTQYNYFGLQTGVGVEFRVARHVGLNIDAIGFVRGRTDDKAATNPEFVDPTTGKQTNTSGGGLFRGGLTVYWLSAENGRRTPGGGLRRGEQGGGGAGQRGRPATTGPPGGGSLVGVGREDLEQGEELTGLVSGEVHPDAARETTLGGARPDHVGPEDEGVPEGGGDDLEGEEHPRGEGLGGLDAGSGEAQVDHEGGRGAGVARPHRRRQPHRAPLVPAKVPGMSHCGPRNYHARNNLGGCCAGLVHWQHSHPEGWLWADPIGDPARCKKPARIPGRRC